MTDNHSFNSEINQTSSQHHIEVSENSKRG